MLDVMGNELNEGDYIVLIPQNGFCGELSVGCVKGFTKDKVKVKIIRSGALEYLPVCLKEPKATCKVNKEEFHND